MGRYPVYFILGLIFFGILKLIQVNVFDAETYKKNKKEYTYRYLKAKKSTEKKTTTQSTKQSSEEKKKNAVPLKKDSEEQAFTEPAIDEASSSRNSNDEANGNDTRSIADSGLSDLKNAYLAPILERLPEGQLRPDIVVRYYKHEKDGNKVYVLKDLGYYIHEKVAKETAGLGSNVIYYGDRVPVQDIKLVALTLIQSGLLIKDIQPTQFKWKSKAIEIGTDIELADSPPLNANEVLTFSK